MEMDLEYKNGVRVTSLLHEMSPLDCAISRYEKLAKKHYSQGKKETGLTKKQCEKKLEESLAHLKKERAMLKAITSVQSQLAEYRKKGMLAVNGTDTEKLQAVNLMSAEGHHKKDLKLLEKNMREEAAPKPSSYHTAHHIVPGKGQHAQKNVLDARLHMHDYGIRINDPANGVYLVHVHDNTPHHTMSNSFGHRKYHTKEYEQFVSRRIQQLHHIDFIKTELQIIGRMLQEYEPKDAIQKVRERGMLN